jgi:hypothetical protein
MDAHLQSLLNDCINGESGGLGVAGGSALSFVWGVDSLAFEVWRGMVEVVRGVCDGVSEYGDDIGDGDAGEERQERYWRGAYIAGANVRGYQSLAGLLIWCQIDQVLLARIDYLTTSGGTNSEVERRLPQGDETWVIASFGCPFGPGSNQGDRQKVVDQPVGQEVYRR